MAKQKQQWIFNGESIYRNQETGAVIENLGNAGYGLKVGRAFGVYKTLVGAKQAAKRLARK